MFSLLITFTLIMGSWIASCGAFADEPPQRTPSASSDPKSEKQAAGDESDFSGRAEKLLDQLLRGSFQEASASFDREMLKAMPAASLEMTWNQIIGQTGPLKSKGTPHYEKLTRKSSRPGTEFHIVVIPCEFEKALLDARVVFNSDKTIGGLQFRPGKPDLVGEELWEGVFDAGGVKLRFIFHLGKKKDGTPTGFFDSIDQAARGLPFDSVKIESKKMKLTATTLGVEFEGTISDDGREVSGQWKQAGQSTPFQLKRIDKMPEARRPQTPRRPYPYREIEVTYGHTPKEADGTLRTAVRLAGTLTVPEGDGPFPAVILITGSGSQDRDETVFDHKPFLVLADHLTRRGIAVLRSDDRGVGGSTGNPLTSTTVDFVDDVTAAFDFLKDRSEIDEARIGLIGHSEGGLIAPLVAERRPEVAFLVLLAGSALPGETILYHQSQAILEVSGASPTAIRVQREIQEIMFRIAKQPLDEAEASRLMIAAVQARIAKLDQAARTEIGNVSDRIEPEVKRVLSPWFRFFLTYDPRPTLAKVRCPVLALNGSKDLQVVPRENLAAIAESLTRGGNPDFQTYELGNLNHLFQTCQTGLVSEYGQLEESFSPQVLNMVAEWIAVRFVRRRE